MIGKCESNINGATGHLEEPVEGPFQSSTAFRRSFLYNLSRNRLRFYQRHGNVNSLWAKWLAKRICSRLRTKITKWHHRLPDSVSRNSILGLPAQSLLLSYLKWPLEALGNLWRGLFYGLAFNIVQRSGNKHESKKPKGCKSASQETLHRMRSACWTGRRSQPGRLHGLMSW